jgi:hypothetical protein
MRSDDSRTLAEYISELQRRDRNDYSSREHPTIDTKVKDDSNRLKGHWSRDDGRSENSSR